MHVSQMCQCLGLTVTNAKTIRRLSPLGRKRRRAGSKARHADVAATAIIRAGDHCQHLPTCLGTATYTGRPGISGRAAEATPLLRLIERRAGPRSR